MSRNVRSKVTSISSGSVDARDNWGTTWDNSRWSQNKSGYESPIADTSSTNPSHTFKSRDYCKRECISIHLGQAGVQIASACWQLYCLEHNIGCDGKALDSIDGSGGEAFFQETESGKYVPRAVLVDLEPSVVDEVRTGELRELYHPDYMLTGFEDAANNFARGYLTVGTSIIEPVVDWIRRMAENCDSLQGFFLYHSLGGGTGSGFTALLLETLEHEFRKKCKLEFIVYPSPLVSSAIVEPYNAVMNTYFCLDYIDCAFMVDNEALYESCVLKLDINRPNFTQLNRIIAQVASSVTASLRFKGALNIDMNEFQTNLVPFPRLHYPVTSYAPLLSRRKVNHENVSVKDITSNSFDRSHQLVKCNMSKGEYIACCLLYRGDVTPKDVNASIARVKRKKGIKFVDWSPTGFKVGINYQIPCMARDVNMAQVRRAVCMMSNNTAIAETWHELTNKFDLMYIKKAFVHWYNAEGMCNSTMELARNHVTALKMDYEQLGKPLDDELTY